MSPARDRRAGTRVARPGREALGRDHMADVQRSRMIAAMVDVAVERGLANATVAHVVARSGVSRRTFYDLFEDREDCFMAALDDSIARAAEYVAPAYQEGGERWRERMRGGLVGLLSFLEEEPVTGRLLVAESLAAGPAALERRREVIARLIAAVDEGRGEGKARREAFALSAEGVVGAVLAVLHARLIERERRPLIGLTSPLMGMIVLPYLGPAAADREIARPAPRPHRRAREGSRDPLRELEMRLTYRTVRVLMVVGGQPGASNREIGRASGVEDQGQISKLLSRLERLGLVENSGEGHVRGGPNAWALTDRGREVEAAILPFAASPAPA